MNKGIDYHIAYPSGGSIDTDSFSRGMTIYRILKMQVKLDHFIYWNNRDCSNSAKRW